MKNPKSEIRNPTNGLRRLLLAPIVCRVLVLSLAGMARLAAQPLFSDDFTSGINPTYWTVRSNQPLYVVDATHGDVRFSKPVGGSYSFQSVELWCSLTAQGDFDARVDFTNASIRRIDGSPGNQVQLNSSFGGQYFGLVRSDEAAWGQNVHVWSDPPAAGYGARSTTTNSGTLRVVRTGVHVQAYLDATLIYEANYNANDATLWLSLQNNGTRDATAVTFDNFQLLADGLLPPWPRITSATNATAKADWYFTYQITATGNPTGYGASGLPSGLGLNSTNGIISGAPTWSGTFAVVLSATNNYGIGTTNLTLTIDPNLAVEWPVAQGGNGHSYRAVLVGPAGINWADASAAAVAGGGHLATIASAAENVFVYSLVTNAQFWWLDGVGNGEGPWLGGFQPPGSPEPAGNWQWVTGEPFAYLNWAPAEPNNANGTEDRLVFTGKGKLMDSVWNDFANSALELGYVIEYDLPTLRIQLAPPNQVVLSWPAWAASYVLESIPALPATGPWQTVTNSPVILGDLCFVTNDMPGAASFYRLRH